LSGPRGDELLALCKDSLARAGAAHAEAWATHRARGCARFAGGELGQHMQLEEPLCVVRVAIGSRVAEAQTSRLEVSAIAEAIARAAKAAPLLPETEGFPGFAPAGDPATCPPRFAEDTAAATPEARAALLAPLLDRVRAAGLVAAGMLESSRSASAVATTEGCARAHDDTVASFKVWALETPGAGGAAGYGGAMHQSLAALPLERETERAVRMCALGKNPIELDAGRYDVVMEPAAIADLVEWLSTIAFGAPEVEQGGSPMTSLGKRITGEHVTIRQDPTVADPALGFGVPFDREGTAKKRVTLIDHGVARAILYDRTYAARARTTSTGSARLGEVGGPGAIGASNLHMEGGAAASVDELLAGIDRGLYVCRLHYVNGYLETPRAVMTGLTRDGCFLVERGKIARAVGNMRFTDSFLEGLARCDGMTRERTAIPTWLSADSSMVVPAVRMRAFHFNGKSQRAVTSP
jgi:predicted Zn-dependent protease